MSDADHPPSTCLLVSHGISTSSNANAATFRSVSSVDVGVRGTADRRSGALAVGQCSQLVADRLTLRNAGGDVQIQLGPAFCRGAQATCTTGRASPLSPNPGDRSELQALDPASNATPEQGGFSFARSCSTSCAHAGPRVRRSRRRDRALARPSDRPVSLVGSVARYAATGTRRAKACGNPR